MRNLVLACFVLGGAALPACGDCEHEQSAVRQFIETHQSCEVDADCVVVTTGCFTIPSGLCGQAIMSREASETVEWAELQRDLFDCSEDPCAVCNAALSPGSCLEGSCGGAP
jgi:hypothetical protein